MTEDIPIPPQEKFTTFTEESVARKRARDAARILTGGSEGVSVRNNEFRLDPNKPAFIKVTKDPLPEPPMETSSPTIPLKPGIKTSEGILAYVLVSLFAAGGTAAMEMAQTGASTSNTTLSVVGTVLASIFGVLAKMTHAKYSNDRKELKMETTKS